MVKEEDAETEEQTTEEEEEIVGKGQESVRYPTSSRRWATAHTSPVKKSKCPSPDSDSSYVDSGEEGEGEEGASGEVDNTRTPGYCAGVTGPRQHVCVTKS